MSPSDEVSYVTNSGSKKNYYTLIGFKFLELCLVICCIGLIDEPATHSHTIIFLTPRIAALCYVTFGCMIIYTSIYLIMTIFGDVNPWRTSTLWNFIAFILFVVCTGMLFRDWSTTKNRNYWHPSMQRLDLVLATASMSLVTSIIYLIDMLLTIRFGLNGDLE